MKKLPLLMSLFFILLLAPTGYAQSETKNPDKDDKLLTEGEGASEKPMRVWIAVARAKPLREAKSGALAVVGAKALEYMSEYYVARKSQDTNYYFLAEPDTTKTKVLVPVGWVHEGELLFQLRALRIPGAFNMHQKAVIVNTDKSLEQAREPFLTFTNDYAADFGFDGTSNPTTVSERVREAFRKKNVILSDKTVLERSLSNDDARIVVDQDDSRFYRFEVIKEDAQTIKLYDSYAMVSVDDSPRADAVRRAGFRLNNTFYVYKKYPNDDKPTHYLLGLESAIPNSSLPENVRNIIKGWVPLQRVQLWNTSQGLRWTADKERPQGLIFGSLESALRSRAGVGGDPPLVVVTETPALDYAPETSRMLVLKAAETEKDARGHEVPKIFEIASPAVLNPRAGKVSGSNAEMDKLREKLKRILEGYENLDLVWVIDDSNSMQKCFAPVGKLVKELLDRALSDRLVEDSRTKMVSGTIRRLRVAVTFYSDKEAGDPVLPGELKEIFNFNTSADDAKKNIDALANSIIQHKFRAGGDDPEQLFEGIEQSIDKIRSQLNDAPLSRRVMLVIGDACSHPLSGRGGKPLSDDEAIAKLVKKLNPNSDQLRKDEEGESPFEFYPIRVEDDNTDPARRQQESVKMRKQMWALVDALNKKEQLRTGRKETTVARFFPSIDSDGREGGVEVPEDRIKVVRVPELLSAIRSRFEQIRDDLNGRVAAISKLQYGEWPSNPNKVDPRVLSDLAKVGWTPERLAKLADFEIYINSYVWRLVPTKDVTTEQVRTEFRLAAGELEEVKSCLMRITELDEEILSTPSKLKELFRQMLETLSREKSNTYATFEEAFKSRFGIVTRSGILNKKESELTDGLKANSEEIVSMWIKANLLDDIFNGSYRTTSPDGDLVQLKPELRGEKYFKPNLPEKKKLDKANYFKQPGSSLRFFWVPLEAFP